MAGSDAERQATEVARYLSTGEHDMWFPAWTGSNTVDRLQRGTRDLQEALIAELQRRVAAVATTVAMPAALRELDGIGFVRRKAEAMVRGLFPQAEQDIVLSCVERAVMFLTPETIAAVVMDCDWLSTAWDVGNIYLASMHAEPLGADGPQLVGLCDNQRCYVSVQYFAETDPYADFVVHEIAHIFHNCLRRDMGLPETRGRKYPLAIHYSKRETFAYACEAYARIIERASSAAERQALARDFAGFGEGDSRVDPSEVAAIVRDACARRYGWAHIRDACRE